MTIMIEKCGPNITTFNLKVSSPDCWDGKNLDSKDHRSHVASASYGSIGIYKCPRTHPKIIPQFTLTAHYEVDPATDDLRLWRLSSDEMAGTKAGGSFHADLWDAWDSPTKKMWTQNCIDRLLNCSGGDLGNGKQMKLTHGYKQKSPRIVVDIPAKPPGHDDMTLPQSPRQAGI